MSKFSHIKVAHVVGKIKGVSIPVELASAISQKRGVDVGLVSVTPLPSSGEEPDILTDDVIIREYSPITSYRHLIQDLIGDGFDIIHTHHNRSSLFVSLLSNFNDINHINTQHGHIHYTILQKVVNLGTLMFCNSFTYNSKNTEKSYNWIENRVRTGGHHRVIHNGVDLDRLAPFQKSEYGSMRTLVTASRLIRRKNISLVLEALQTFSSLEFVIVGDGPLRNNLERRARELGVGEQVTFEGFVQDRKDVYRILSRGDVFIHPSFSEGFCVAVAEAMGLGLPVVVSDIPVFHEVVGEGGLFIDPLNPESLKKTLRWLINNADDAETRGRRNQHRIETHFALDDIAAQYVDAYRSMLQPGEVD